MNEPARLSRPPRRPRLLHAAVLGMALLGPVAAGPAAAATEEPAFTVVQREGDIELRRYAPMIVAETVVEGEMDEATGKGFRAIAAYIFGSNVATGAGAQSTKIEMTAPVTVTPEKAAGMPSKDAPLTVSAAEENADMRSVKRWRVHFVMPSQYTMTTLPRPRNPAVVLREVPARHYVALRFSGSSPALKVQQKNEIASAWIKARKLDVLGPPQLARYDPPWTLPMWRRNEILIEVAAP